MDPAKRTLPGPPPPRRGDGGGVGRDPNARKPELRFRFIHEKAEFAGEDLDL